MEEAADRAAAQRRADRIRAFREELAQLEREGALELTVEQRATLDLHQDAALRDLAARFDIDASERARQMSWGMRIAATLGAFALCMALVLFFHRIWGSLPEAAAVALLASAPLACLAAAEWTARRETAPYFTLLAAAIAFAAFVLDLNVLGGMFNLAPGPHALLAWALFAGALAWRFGLRLLMAAALVCAIGWAAALAVSPFGYWAEFVQRPETVLAAGVAAMFAPSRREFASTHRMVGALAAVVAVLFLSFEGATLLPLTRQAARNLYQGAGIAGSAALVWLAVRRGWDETVRIAAGAFVVFLYIRLVDWWWDWLPKYLFFLLAGAIAIGLLLAFRRLRGRAEARP